MTNCVTCGSVQGEYRVHLTIEELGWKDYLDFDQIIYQCEPCKIQTIKFFRNQK